MNLTDKFEKMNILCIDPSLSCTGLFYSGFISNGDGVIRKTGDKYSYINRIAKNKTSAKDLQLALINYDIMNRTKEDCDLVIMENYSFGEKKSRSITVLAEVRGVIKLALYLNGIPYIEVPPQTWMKWSAFGKPMKKSTKKNIADYIAHGKSIYNLDYKTPDEVDATMIYVACKNYLQSLDSGVREKKVPECLIQLEDFVRKI